jgi:hypothetical protein
VKIHTLAKRLEKSARDLQLEIAAMGPEDRTRWGESREHLAAELELLETLQRTIEEWHTQRARLAVAKLSLLNQRKS